MARKHYDLPFTLLLCLLLLVSPGCISAPKTIDIDGPPQPEIGSDSDPSQQVKNLSMDELLARGADHIAKGNFELATIHYNQALVNDPQSTAALVGLGDLFWNRGKHLSAQKAYSKAISIENQNIAALIGAGKAHRVLGSLDQSEAQLTRAVEYAPNHPEALTELAIVYDHRGRYSQAEPIYRQVIDMAPGKPGPLNNLGFNLLLQRRYSEALDPLRKALSLMPKGEHIQNNLAAAYLLTNQESRAMTLFKDTVGQAGAWNNLGYIHMAQEEWDAAERAFNKALDANPVFYARAKQNLERVKEQRNEQNH